MEGRGDITQLLHKWGEGDQDALNDLVIKVYDRLRELAGGYLRRESHEITLQATALVNEVYLKLEGQTIAFNDSDHFFRVAARMMRRLLTSSARSRKSLKRGQGLDRALSQLEDEPADDSINLDSLITVENALSRLESNHPRLARIVELRVFVGLQNDEIGELLNISLATVKRDWTVAKRRLYLALKTISD